MIEGILVEFQTVSKQFDDDAVLESIDFKISVGKIHVILGESGSGKTTILRMINGLILPTSGSIFVEGAPLDYQNIVPLRRRMGYVIQESGLFPHMTVRENISLVSKRTKLPHKEIESRTHSLLKMVNLQPESTLHKRPSQLSGGERQRVGIARALMLHPSLLLMDEPFGALDPITRCDIQDEFLSLQKRLNLTVIFVTHDIREAFKIGDDIILLHQGKIAQQDHPRELLLHPKNEYVSQFLHSHSPEEILAQRGFWPGGRQP